MAEGITVTGNQTYGLDPGLVQSAGTLAALQVAGRLTPVQAGELGRAVGAFNAVREYLVGDESFQETKLGLLGGISMKQVQDAYRKVSRHKLAHKNFWFIQVAPLMDDPNMNSLPSGFFNLFAIEVDYSPSSVSGDAQNIGATFVDHLQSSDRAELRITTLDDTRGTLKRWFAAMSKKMANRETGTFGVPFSYATNFYIFHAAVEGYDAGGDQVVATPYQDVMMMRPGSIDFNLSRREGGMQEVTMTFVQMDPFMAVRR